MGDYGTHRHPAEAISLELDALDRRSSSHASFNPFHTQEVKAPFLDQTPPPFTSFAKQPDVEFSKATQQHDHAIQPLQRPSLPAPELEFSSNPIDKQIYLADKMQETQVLKTDIACDRLERHHQNILKIQMDHLDLVRETAAKTQEKDTWSFLQNIATCLFSAASIIIGLSVATAGGWPAMIAGGLMTSGGVTSLAALTLKELGVDHHLIGALSLTSAALSLVGGGMGFFNYINELPKLLVTTVSIALTLCQAVTGAGKNWTDAEMAKLDQAKTALQKELQAGKDKEKQILGDFTDKEKIKIHEVLSKSIEQYNEAIEMVNRSHIHA